MEINCRSRGGGLRRRDAVACWGVAGGDSGAEEVRLGRGRSSGVDRTTEETAAKGRRSRRLWAKTMDGSEERWAGGDVETDGRRSDLAGGGARTAGRRGSGMAGKVRKRFEQEVGPSDGGDADQARGVVGGDGDPGPEIGDEAAEELEEEGAAFAGSARRVDGRP